MALRRVDEGEACIAHLTGKLLRDEHLSTLAADESAAAVIELHLRNNQIGDAGVRALVAAELPLMEYLSLSSNRIGDDGARALLGALRRGAWPRLRQLYLGGNAIGAEVRAELKAYADTRDIVLPFL